MLLSDIEILDRLVRNDNDDKAIIIEPLVGLQYQLGPGSLDIHLGYEFRVFKGQQYTHLNPFGPASDLERDVRRYTNLVVIDPDPVNGRFILHPGQFALASTLEFIGLPADISARLEGRSSWGRLGLQIHATAGYVDPGFRGTVTYELHNIGQLPIPLVGGLRIGQLAFFRSGRDALMPYSAERKYQDQFGPSPSRFYSDPEMAILRSRIEEEEVRKASLLLRRLGFGVSAPG